MRLRAQQSWPALAYTDIGSSRAAFARSASANTMAADLPPSSSDTRAMLSADAFRIDAPVVVSPVNEILATRGSDTRASPTTPPGPGSTLTISGGTPASTRTSPRSSAVSGVSDAGLSTIGLPHTSAGATFHEAISNGKFHGTISATGPTGSRSTTSR